VWLLIFLFLQKTSDRVVCLEKNSNFYDEITSKTPKTLKYHNDELLG
jgi:hypothetical protein